MDNNLKPSKTAIRLADGRTFTTLLTIEEILFKIGASPDTFITIEDCEGTKCCINYQRIDLMIDLETAVKDDNA